MIDACFAELKPLIGTAGACRGSGKSRATHYRRCRPPMQGPARPRETPSNALSKGEVDELLAVLRSPRFVDLAPAQVWAVLLDEGRYLASISTMYRVLRGADEVRERRACRRSRNPAAGRFGVRVIPQLVVHGFPHLVRGVGVHPSGSLYL